MIISHEHRFVFVKNRKTGGSSVEMALEPIAGDDAVVTPLLPRPAEWSGPRHRNWQGWCSPLPEAVENWRRRGGGWDLRDKGVARPPLRNARSRRRYYEHMSYALARRRAGKRIDGYFSFCFERNPWDKAVSWWAWAHRDRGPQRFPEDFERWLLGADRRGFYSDWFMYTRRDRIAVDFVGRFEDLESDFASVVRTLGIDEALTLPREKVSVRAAPRPLSDRAHDCISEMFRREIDAFGYEPPAGFR